MALVDEVVIHAAAGRGGGGVVRWLHLRGREKGGPSGGNGGWGGGVLLEGVRDIAALARYRYEKDFHAENGGSGEKDLKHGKNGADLVLFVPVGTVARIEEADIAYEIMQEGERTTLFKGGAGGKGNAHFKSSTNQNPFEHTEGKAGGVGDVRLSLKLIADAGLIGLPNVGKSSLLNALTKARTKTADYPFTTLEPHLGDLHGFILADIPGLIEGASEGKGLGARFLKHIERTGTLIHLVSASEEDPARAYRGVRAELERFGHGLAEKAEILVLSKTDLVKTTERKTKYDALTTAAGKEPWEVSVKDETLFRHFSNKLLQTLKR